MNSHPTPLGVIGQIARGLVVLLIGYWGLFALLAPVTVWDAQVYNLGRLPIISQAGLFGHGLWSTERQLSFPWSFDAIHWPFVVLGWGYGIPSFLCLVATLMVAWQFVKDRRDATAAWLMTLALLALPTLVFQAVGSKNDVAVLFGVAVWFYSLLKWQRVRKVIYIVLASTALGFAAGAKTSGLIPVTLCSVLTLIWCRHDRRAISSFLISLIIAALLLGSVETYLESHRKSGTPLGSPEFIAKHKNEDGLAGAAANAVRYAFGNLNTGVEIWQKPDTITPIFERACRRLLQSVGLKNTGHKHRDYNDENFRFLENGWDSSQDFGVLGTAAVVLALTSLIVWRPRKMWWRLSAFAVLVTGATCYTIAWMPWNNRFLLLPVAALTIALTLIATAPSRLRPVWSTLMLVVSAYAAIAYPIQSYNKTPRDLYAGITDRETQTAKERPGMKAVVDAVLTWSKQNPNGRLLLLPGPDSWVLPLFTLERIETEMADETSIITGIDRALGQSQPTLVLPLNRADFEPDLIALRTVARVTEEADTVLYEVRNAAISDGPPGLDWASGNYTDGWTADTFEIAVENWAAGTVLLIIWNPLEFPRRLTLTSRRAEHHFEIAAQGHLAVEIEVDFTDLIHGTVDPVFVPAEHGESPDSRPLGVRLNLEQP